MKLCLAGASANSFLKDTLEKSDYVLESFYYVQDWQLPYIKSKHWKLFLLDSGAFTMMNSQKKIDYEDYLNRYIDFINEHDIDYFFELDIDYLIAYSEVLKLREKLETETKKKCIPVFHKTRGINEWHKMCKQYDYVAIGTIYKYKQNSSILRELLKIAKSYGTKVHGLGYTPHNVKEFDFYSVDSTSWVGDSRFGRISLFFNGKIRYIQKKGYRTIDYKIISERSLNEWIKFQKYLDKEEQNGED